MPLESWCSSISYQLAAHPCHGRNFGEQHLTQLFPRKESHDLALTCASFLHRVSLDSRLTPRIPASCSSVDIFISLYRFHSGTILNGCVVFLACECTILPPALFLSTSFLGPLFFSYLLTSTVGAFLKSIDSLGKNTFGDFQVLVSRAGALRFDHDSCWDVCHLGGGGGLVNLLATGTAAFGKLVGEFGFRECWSRW